MFEADAMNGSDFVQFLSSAEHAEVLFFYRGEFTPPVVAAAAESLKERLARVDASGPARRRLFSTFVEMAQNVVHYAAETPLAPGAPLLGKTGTITITRAPEPRYWIACCNPVDARFVPRLTQKLETLRAMSLEQIKQSYRAQLHNTEHESADAVSRGAGLGLLTIARDSAAPLEYAFTPVPGITSDDRNVLFHMRALI